MNFQYLVNLHLPREVDKDFSAKIPKIFFAVEGFKCELSLNNHMAVQTTKMLRDYMSLDPRVHTLAVVIRYWARLCGIDRQAEGTLPAHAFALLLVFFLQQETKPVLPCLHEHLEKRDADAYESPLKNLRYLIRFFFGEHSPLSGTYHCSLPTFSGGRRATE